MATTVAAAAIMIVGVACISLFQGDGLEALTEWPMWILIVVGTVLMAGPFSYLTYAAGADWLLVERVRFGVTKRIWTDLYDLTKVDVSPGGTTFHLTLWSDRGGFGRSFEELQQDRRIWDLVYNGIAHSVANGATISFAAIGVLQLNKTPALRLRDEVIE